MEPSDCDWASQAFFVPKKAKGEWRLVVDYRGLNEQTEHDSYSLPLMDTICKKQARRRIFTVLDLKHGYHQMPLHGDSGACTLMSTPLGPMQWKVVLGGSSCMVKNDGKCRKMTGFQRQQIIVVLMDISVLSRTSMAKQIFL